MEIKVLQLGEEPDKSGDILPEDAEIEFSNQITLIRNFKQNKARDIIGYANLYRNGDTFYIRNIEIYEDYQEVFKNLTPAINGKVLAFDDSPNVRIIKHFSIDSVSFQLVDNHDPRIKSVEEQLKEIE